MPVKYLFIYVYNIVKQTILIFVTSRPDRQLPNFVSLNHHPFPLRTPPFSSPTMGVERHKQPASSSRPRRAKVNSKLKSLKKPHKSGAVAKPKKTKVRLTPNPKCSSNPSCPTHTPKSMGLFVHPSLRLQLNVKHSLFVTKWYSNRFSPRHQIISPNYRNRKLRMGLMVELSRTRNSLNNLLSLGVVR